MQKTVSKSKKRIGRKYRNVQKLRRLKRISRKTFKATRRRR